MSELKKEKIVFSCDFGSVLRDCIELAIKESIDNRCDVEFEFNNRLHLIKYSKIMDFIKETTELNKKEEIE